MKKEYLIISLLLVLTIPAVKSLFQPGGYTSHDLTHHVIRQIDMDRLLSEGQFPPRWSGNLNKGFGYPLFLFNYPLPALIGEIFVKLNFGYVSSVKAVLFLSLIISALGMYLFLKSLLGSKSAAFIGAIFYLYAPIRFIIVYVSAAVGAALALAFLPFIFWSILKLDKQPKLGILIGSISLAGLILSHNVTALMFAPVILGFGLLKAKKESLGRLGLLGILGIGLSAFFWLPAAVEKQYIRWDLIFGGFYKDHFPSLWQLLHSPWGYGLDNPKGQVDGMSFQIGLAHILVMLLLVIGFWAVRGIRAVKQSLRPNGLREARMIGGFSLMVFLMSVFLMLEISLPVWDYLPFLSYVQFPWRFLSVAVFSAVIVAALLVKYSPLKNITFVFLLILVLIANRNHLNINQVFNPGVEYYLTQRPTTTSFDEDLPIRATPPKEESVSKLEFLQGKGKVEYLENKSNIVKASLESTSSAKLIFNQFYFPGWQLQLDGKVLESNYQQKDHPGLPVFEIPEGKHDFVAEFKNTPIRNLADLISIIAIGIWISLLFTLSFRGAKRRRNLS